METGQGEPFPERGLLLAMTFGVVGTSLLLQGLTMGPLLRRLGLAGAAERAVQQGQSPEEYGEVGEPTTG